MRFLTIVIGLFLTFSCTTKEDGVDNLDDSFSADTISVAYKRYSSLLDDPSGIFAYLLIREKYGDSLLTFKYLKDTILTRQYDFLVSQGQFKLIQDTTDYEHLVPVDTFAIQLLGEQLIIYKYEKFLPTVDGAIGILFNNKYGRIGYSSYDWGNQTILINWDDKKFGNELKSMLLADNVRYLKRQDVISPPSSE